MAVCIPVPWLLIQAAMRSLDGERLTCIGVGMIETTVGDLGASFTGEDIAVAVVPLRRKLQHIGVARPGAAFDIHEVP